MKREKNSGKKNDWTDTETQAYLGLVRAQQYLNRKVEEELRQKGFPPLNWYDVLWELDKAPDGSLRLNELGRKVLFDKYNTTRIVQRLEEEGYVERNQCPVDGRGIFACITDKGRKLRKRMWPVYRETVQKYFFSKFDKKEIVSLRNFIERIQASGLS